MSTSFFDDDDDDDLNLNADESQLSRTSAGVSAASRAGPSRPGQDARHQQQQRRQQSVVNDGRTDTRTARQREKSRDTSAFGGDEMELDLDAEGDGLGQGKGKGAGQDASETETETEVEQLMRHWMDERMAPEVLGHREELVNRLMARLEAQVRPNAFPLWPARMGPADMLIVPIMHTDGSCQPARELGSKQARRARAHPPRTDGDRARPLPPARVPPNPDIQGAFTVSPMHP
jgi:hypothetical protein